MDRVRRVILYRAVFIGFLTGALVGDAVGGALVQRIGVGVSVGLGATLILYYLLSVVVVQASTIAESH